ncbi:MAG: AlpA family phage regulatory protein [Pseudomonadota bacterium]
MSLAHAIADLESERDSLKEERDRLATENEELRRQISDRPSYDPILPTAEVVKMTGRSPSSLRMMVKRQTFPAAFKPPGADRCIGWRKSDVENWLDGRIAIASE